MIYVLDTNAVSALMKGVAAAITRLEAVGRRHIRVPEPVFAEIAYGIQRLPRSKRKGDLARLFHSLRETFEHAAWDGAVTDHFAETKAALEARGEGIEDFDVAIAAHALALDAVLVTGNHSHMSRIAGLRVEDWTR